MTFRFALNIKDRHGVWAHRQESDRLEDAASQWISRLARFCLVLLLFLVVCDSGHLYAQNNSQQNNPLNTTAALNNTPNDKESKKDKKGKKPRKKLLPGSFVVAPIPIVSPAIGDGIIPVVGYIFPFNKNDKISPPSTVGVGGLITDNGSRAYFLGGQLFFDKNKYEVTTGYAHGNINYNIYGAGFVNGPQDLKLPLVQTGEVFFAEALRRFWWQIFIGPRLTVGSSFITVGTINNPNIPPIPPDVGLHTNLRALGVRTVRDTRANHFFPTGGSKVEFTADFYAQALGSKQTFQQYKLHFDKYMTVHKNQVLAVDGYVCNVAGDAPFYQKCIYGASNELRGYTAGTYFDRHMFTAQAEYRLSLPKRIGLAAFGGLGYVRPGDSEFFTTSHFLPDIGGGPRFELSKQYHVNLRADFARGVGSWTWSMGIGEAF
ncbi:MAG TPA: BamA/TamA family outer membrane protein [Acidobacteriaceae bacterium]|nr:BamA/TamA family outer membrane protein [Acidobacteriaceae bacterium]